MSNTEQQTPDKSYCYFTDGSRKVILDAWKNAKFPNVIIFILNDGMYAYCEDIDPVHIEYNSGSRLRPITILKHNHCFYQISKAECIDRNITPNMWIPGYWIPLLNIDRIELLTKDLAI